MAFDRRLENIFYQDALRTTETAVNGTSASAGILIDNSGFYGAAANQGKNDANVRILADGSAFFSGALTASSIFVGDSNRNLQFDTTNGLQISDPKIFDYIVAGEDITSGNVVMIMNNGTLVKANNFSESIPRHYGIAVETKSAGQLVKVQKTGIFTTTGLTPGGFYGAGSTYETETITIDQTTGGSSYDASLGVGQSFTTTKLFTDSVALHLSSPLGTGSYAYRCRFYPLYPSEGGPARNAVFDSAYSVASINRSGTTATVVMAAGPTLSPAIDWYVLIAGAVETQYNGWQRITGVSVTGSGATYTFTVAGGPSTPATGTITAKFRPFFNSLSGNASLTGTGDNFLRFNFSTKQYEEYGKKVLVEFRAVTAGQMNIEYSASSVYSGGELWLGGVVDSGKDVRIRIRETFGSGSLALLSDTYDPTVGGFTSGHPLVSISGANSAIGLAKSSTELLLGNYSRQ